MKILLGPILGYEFNAYSVCFLSDTNGAPTLSIDGKAIAFEKIATTPQGVFWRAYQQIPPKTNYPGWLMRLVMVFPTLNWQEIPKTPTSSGKP